MSVVNKAVQCLVNAQVSVNRAVFEGNQDRPRCDYLAECATNAIRDLSEALQALNKQRAIMIGLNGPKKGDRLR